MQEEEIKQHLMASSPEYQRLINEHHQFEDRLKELQSHHHLSDQDLIEEAKIKKEYLIYNVYLPEYSPLISNSSSPSIGSPPRYFSWRSYFYSS